MICKCPLSGSSHYPWCDYFPGGLLTRHPDGSDWDLWDNPVRIGERILQQRDLVDDQTSNNYPS